MSSSFAAGVTLVASLSAFGLLLGDESAKSPPQPLWSHKLGHWNPLGATEDGAVVILGEFDPAKEKDGQPQFRLESRDAKTGKLLHQWAAPKGYQTTMYLRVDPLGLVRMLLREENAILPRMPVFTWDARSGKGRLHRFVGQHIVLTHFGSQAWFIKLSPTPQGPRVTAYSFESDEPLVEDLVLAGFSPYAEDQSLLGKGTVIASSIHEKENQNRTIGSAIADLKSRRITRVPPLEDGSTAYEFADTGLSGLAMATYCLKDQSDKPCIRLFDIAEGKWLPPESAFLVPKHGVESYYAAGEQQFATQVNLKSSPKHWQHLPGSNLEAETAYALWFAGSRPPQPPVLLAVPKGETARKAQFVGNDRLQIFTEKNITAEGTFEGVNRIYNLRLKAWEGQRPIKEPNPPHRAIGTFPLANGLTLSVNQKNELEAWNFADYWQQSK